MADGDKLLTRIDRPESFDAIERFIEMLRHHAPLPHPRRRS
jgi:hypothetical protein